MPIRATDDEALAQQLWGDDKHWDGERKQFVPNAEGTEEVQPSPGHSSDSSESGTVTQSSGSDESPRQTAPTTEPPSSKGRKASSTARSTGGPGAAE